MKHLALTTALVGSLALPAAAETIGVSIPAATHGWAGALNFHAEQTVERLEKQYENLDFVLTTTPDSGTQISDLEDMVATRNIDALVVLPFESEPLTGPIQRIAESGTWVTVVDRGLSQEGIENLYVAGDNESFGKTAGDYFVENLDEGSKVVVLRGIPTSIDNERVEAFQAALDGSGVEVLAMEHGNWNRDDAFTVMQDYLSRYPEIDAVWAADDDMAVGAIGAIEQAGREDEMWVVGGAGMKEMVRRVQEGDDMVPVDVTYPPAMIATAIELTALGVMSEGVPMSGEFILSSELITQENAEQYYYEDSPY
ncbi:ABC transporter substrate-binding protein [Allosediminivita pacifica]|uniref:Monosaccharide ABC transporter substrate-binding protein (CUT2 family) n=1 Tax=Allosediminivita pacifica TaxID=1267769 RepID=A0A2T6AUI6_9RHOB|nr:ABC transporter substrate-binding protein [Allosediminivita pacifica]PTX47396.1 monosaccharide ABC transporter substrate-binding protein (CUT2 family) [Allosediminivita pacifica]GGB13936.1 ABC transporter substrate-binding protein [Allosediminivita pacifica]